MAPQLLAGEARGGGNLWSGVSAAVVVLGLGSERPCWPDDRVWHALPRVALASRPSLRL